MPPELLDRSPDAFSGCRCRTCGTALTIAELYTACSACWWQYFEIGQLEVLAQ